LHRAEVTRTRGRTAATRCVDRGGRGYRWSKDGETRRSRLYRWKAFDEIAPIFGVQNLDVALDHYRRLGFAVCASEGGGYGLATRDRVEIHLGVGGWRRPSHARGSSLRR
jgi:hypothetical protein